MQKDSLGKDKLGHLWSVFIDIIPPEQDLQFTSVDFYVCSPSCKGINDVTDFIGKAHLTIQEAIKNIAKIEDIIIEPPYRGRGIGSLLLDYLERWAIQKYINKLYGDLVRVDIDHINTLKRYYKKHGFSIILFKKPTLDPTALVKIQKIIS